MREEKLHAKDTSVEHAENLHPNSKSRTEQEVQAETREIPRNTVLRAKFHDNYKRRLVKEHKQRGETEHPFPRGSDQDESMLQEMENTEQDTKAEHGDARPNCGPIGQRVTKCCQDIDRKGKTAGTGVGSSGEAEQIGNRTGRSGQRSHRAARLEDKHFPSSPLPLSSPPSLPLSPPLPSPLLLTPPSSPPPLPPSPSLPLSLSTHTTTTTTTTTPRSVGCFFCHDPES